MTLMTKTTKGHIITQNLDGTDHLDCLYRISLKALIYNDVGQILVIKEIDRTYWDLPGGGMDFGETIESSLKRELYEEVGYKGDLRYQLFDASDEMYMSGLTLIKSVFIAVSGRRILTLSQVKRATKYSLLTQRDCYCKRAR